MMEEVRTDCEASGGSMEAKLPVGKLAVIPPLVSPVLEPLILELDQLEQNFKVNSSENVNFEQLELLLINLMKSCSGANEFSKQVSIYLLSNEGMMHHLSLLAWSTLTGETIKYRAASCLTLVCECLRLLTDANGLLSIKVAEAEFVIIVLSAMEAIAHSVQYNKVSHFLLMSMLGFIQCLAEDLACWPYFKPTRFVDILGLYTKSKEEETRFMSIYTLSLLVEIIPVVKNSVLISEEKAVSQYISILTEAVSSPNLNATKAIRSLVIPADDVLRLLKHLWYIEQNRHIIALFLESLIFPLEVCLQRGNKKQQKASVDLLWTLISDSSTQSQVVAKDFTVAFQLLSKLADSNSDDRSDSVGAMASCVLYKIDPKLLSEPAILQVIRGTYNFKRYSECIDWCNQVVPPKTNLDSPEKHAAMLYRGKAFCRLFQQEQKIFEEVSHTLEKKEYHQRLNSIYKIAGQGIRDLGFLFDLNNHSPLDDEMSLCLDTCMVNVAYHVNDLKEYSRCLLCLNKAKLHRSHMCPDAILEAFASGLEKTRNKRIFNLSFFKESKMISPHGVIMWLFCAECEITLSRDGEEHFIPKFFKCIYNTESTLQLKHEICIKYDEWLYRFAIGFLFRGLINQAFSSFINSDEIHRMFTILRKLICYKGTLSDLPDCPVVHLLVSPIVPSSSAGFIGHVYHAPFLFALTDKSLENGSNLIPRSCQFFLARIGVLNFLLLFDEKIYDFLPHQARIKVCGGEFVVPPEEHRASTIPDGINQIVLDLAADTQKNLLESSVSTLWNLKLNDPTPPTAQQSETFKAYSAMRSDMEKLDETLLTSYSLDSPQNIDLLPPGFVLEHSNGVLSLPETHRIIFHGDFVIEMEGSDPFNITLFLAAGNEPSSDIFTLKNPYIIFHRHQPGLQVTLGYFVNPDTFSALTFLPDPNPKAMGHDVAKKLKVSAFTKTLLPDLMNLRGFKSYYTVVHRAFLQKFTISYDHVCGKRCWYCKFRCNTCLSLSSINMSTKTSKGSSQKFCSNDCENVYYSNATRELTFFDLSDLSSEHVLLFSFDTTLPRSVGGFSRMDISVYLSREAESQHFPKGSLYIVYQHATTIDQHFLEYFVHKDSSFSHMLHYYKSREYPDRNYGIHFTKQILTEKLQELGIDDLNVLADLFLEQ